jgi:hypothetical protein
MLCFQIWKEHLNNHIATRKVKIHDMINESVLLKRPHSGNLWFVLVCGACVTMCKFHLKYILNIKCITVHFNTGFRVRKRKAPWYMVQLCLTYHF